MSLTYANSYEQALLAFVIREGQKVVERNNWYLGRTTIQKLMYFLKVNGVPMRYKFSLYHYGPYCDDIVSDVYWMITDEVITDTSSDPVKYSDYKTNKAIDELINKFQKEINDYEDEINTIVNAFAPLKPRFLELIATLFYIFREKRATGRNEEFKESVVKEYLERKGDRFTQNEVENEYDRLIEVGLVLP
ncbi:hypothetical protein K9N50_12370 [bacterium]|nr:hypothetical protein [bacterium]